MTSNRACNGSAQVQGNISNFNNERNEDLEIPWFLCYDFIFSEKEAYYQLQPAYPQNTRYPSRLDHENIIVGDENLHPCRVQGCTAKPFTRYCDLERHFKIHQSYKSIFCDYKSCTHRIQHGRDQLRWHYRQHHDEDLNSQGQMQSENIWEAVEPTRYQNLDLTWWRCSKCLLRVEVDDSGYACPGCMVTCEPERVAWREITSFSHHSGCGVNESTEIGTADKYAVSSIEDKYAEHSAADKYEVFSTAEKMGLNRYEILRPHYRTPAANGANCTISTQKASFVRSNRDHNFSRFLITLAFVAGMLMSILYAWVNQKMRLGIPSALMQKIIEVTMRAIPAAVIEASHLVSPNLILMSYLAWAAVWTISIVGWVTARSRKPWFVYSYMYVLLTPIFWVLSKVTPQELLLVFLPVSLSTGGLLYTICEKPLKKDPSRIASSNGHTSLANQATGDLEMNSKA